LEMLRVKVEEGDVILVKKLDRLGSVLDMVIIGFIPRRQTRTG